jgi:hypothetical protein
MDDEDEDNTLTTAEDVEQGILDALADWEIVESISTFEDRGVLTRDRGVVVRMGDGTEFQVTIVQSRTGR